MHFWDHEGICQQFAILWICFWTNIYTSLESEECQLTDSFLTVQNVAMFPKLWLPVCFRFFVFADASIPVMCHKGSVDMFKAWLYNCMPEDKFPSKYVTVDKYCYHLALLSVCLQSLWLVISGCTAKEPRDYLAWYYCELVFHRVANAGFICCFSFFKIKYCSGGNRHRLASVACIHVQPFPEAADTTSQLPSH